MSFIELKDISFSYEKGKQVFSGLDLSLEAEAFTAITGPNGSGKTTLSKLIMGILKPDSGNISVNGEDAAGMSLGEIGAKVGYLFQNPELQIFANTVYQDLSFVMRLKGLDEKAIENKVGRLLERFNLYEYKESSPFNLSFGEKQRLAIAGVLINDPDYLILDEPTTGLDFRRKKELKVILEELLESGIGVSLITHDLDFTERFDARMLRFNSEGRLC